MATPGWYPDPSGQPNSFRYWDGRSWSEQTTPDPSSPPPGYGAPPPPPPGPPAQYGGSDPHAATQMGGPGGDPQTPYGQQGPYEQQDPYSQGHAAAGGQYAGQYGGQYGGQGGGYGGGGYGAGPADGSGGGKKVALVVLVVVLILGLAVGGFFGVRALTDDDGENTASDDSSETTASPEETEETEETEESPSETPSESGSESPSGTPTGPTGRECTGGLPGSAGGNVAGDGTLTGGGLELPPVGGYSRVPVESAFTFADGVVTVGKQIEEQWISLYALGALPKESGYHDPRQAAGQVVDCMTESENFYRNFTDRTDLDQGEIDVDGAPAYSLTSEIRVDDPAISAEGDVAQVIVVDVGHPDAFGLYVSVVPIGDQRLIRQQERVADQLRLD